MRIFIHGLLLLTLLLASTARAQADRKDSSEATGSISGRVTLDGKAAAGVRVVAFRLNQSHTRDPFASARTDASGHFQLAGLPSSRYYIAPVAPAYVASDREAGDLPGRNVTLPEGETIEGFDFSLVRGGVITGRITTADGQPLTNEMITLIHIGPDGKKNTIFDIPSSSFITDDRGIYRVFGLPAGRYIVSVGQDTDKGGQKVAQANYFPRTFYPGVTDESKAILVEVKAGGEATGIDIVLGQPKKTYSASGRIVDAMTGKPIANAQFGYGIMREVKSEFGISRSNSFSSGLKADGKGHFRLGGLLPGTFYVVASTEPNSDLYSTVASFQIQDRDITGLEIKVRRGSSVSGSLVVEGASDPEILAGLSRLHLWAGIALPDAITGAHNVSKNGTISPDGTFRIAGLHPGKAFFHIGNSPESKGFYLLRVERGGIEQPEGIEVRPEEQINDVRIVLAHAAGRIRGQVKVEGGKLPASARINVHVWRVNGSSSEPNPKVEIDANGRFIAEHLIGGEYQVTVWIYDSDLSSSRMLATGLKEKVQVTNGAETEVTVVVDLSAKDNDQE